MPKKKKFKMRFVGYLPCIERVKEELEKNGSSDADMIFKTEEQIKMRVPSLYRDYEKKLIRQFEVREL